MCDHPFSVKIRWKLLVLLLVMTLLPLMLSGIYSLLSTRQLGNHLASQTRDALISAAERQLQLLVDGHQGAQRQTLAMVEAALRVQAREVERRLAEPLPATDRIFFSADYDAGRAIPGMMPSAVHFRMDQGQLVPLDVTYEEQVFFLVRNVSRETVAADMARLAAMPEVYRGVHDLLPDLTYWQYTALDSGFHSSYPGHGGYPPDYDPRTREWYTAARDRGALVWLRPLSEVSTRTIQLAVSMPVYRPDGAFAGVTAIDVPLRGLLSRLPAHAEWGENIWASLVLADESPDEPDLRILADRSYQDRTQDWRRHPDQRYLESGDRAQLADLRKRALAEASGILRMDWRGSDALWAFGSAGPNGIFPVVIVPYESVVRPALEAEQYVVKRARDDFVTGALFVIVMAGLVGIVAFNRSNRLTAPIRDVAATAHALMQGDYHAKVDIHTGDEIQELAEVVNKVGPALEERQRMQRSLELTMGIQQNLLPAGVPSVPGFDISARCVYSEETGGDYYDFMPLFQLGKSKLGIALGDVSGHGLPAAMLMASARGILRSHVELFPDDLGRVFNALNRYFFYDTPSDRFMTLFVGILDGPSRTLMWESGGQGPVLWLHRDSGEVEELEITGACLGIIEDAAYKHAGPIKLAPGDVVLIGTDGIWETRGGPDNEEYGIDNLKQLVRDVGDRSAEAIRDAVIATVAAYRGDAPQDDDVTMIVIKAAPGSEA